VRAFVTKARPSKVGWLARANVADLLSMGRLLEVAARAPRTLVSGDLFGTEKDADVVVVGAHNEALSG
jgi:hypothetical protein